MTDGTIDSINDKPTEHAHSDRAFLQVLNDTTAMIQALRPKELSVEELVLLRRLLRELVEINRLSSTSPSSTD